MISDDYVVIFRPLLRMRFNSISTFALFWIRYSSDVEDRQSCWGLVKLEKFEKASDNYCRKQNLKWLWNLSGLGFRISVMDFCTPNHDKTWLICSVENTTIIKHGRELDLLCPNLPEMIWRHLMANQTWSFRLRK